MSASPETGTLTIPSASGEKVLPPEVTVIVLPDVVASIRSFTWSVVTIL